MTKKHIAVGLGEILWDLLPEGRRLGGAPTNFAYHAHCLGAQGYVISSVGQDKLGDEIIECVDKLGINKDYISFDHGHPTGTVTVELNKDGQPDYIIHENVAWDFIPAGTKLLEFASKVDTVCFGSLGQRSQTSRNTIREFLSSTKEDCIRVFDINIRQHYYSKEIIDLMLGFADVFKVNEQELPVTAELLEISGNEDQILEQLMNKYKLNLIVLTKGVNGSVLFGNGQRSQLDVEEIQVADTVGAGDAFTAAVVMGLLHGNPIEEIHAHANRLAGFVCSQNGGTPELPDEIILPPAHPNTTSR